MFDPDEDFFEKKEWRVPVTSLFTGTISEWKKEDGEWVTGGDTVCTIRTDVPRREPFFEVPAPASGRLGIERRFAKTETWVIGNFGGGGDIIAYIYTDPLL
ncbi:MAG TPA: lipoyl domain-containing protein [Candidatus Brocadiales bacterium]|nr:lipoyl domain-containing protein [Candidatus Brocadiales bacterium]